MMTFLSRLQILHIFHLDCFILYLLVQYFDEMDICVQLTTICLINTREVEVGWTQVHLPTHFTKI